MESFHARRGLVARRSAAPALLCWALGLAAACSAGSSPGDAIVTTTSSADPPPTSLSTTTVAAPESVALFQHEAGSVELPADCYDAGAGAVIVLARDDSTGEQLIVNAIVGESYLEFIDADGVVFEPALDHLVDFTVEDGSVSSGVVNLATDLDLDAGTFTPAGVASFEVDCRAYIHGPPVGY